ncbi:hypothetical protein L1887_58617 [Cichorium endivia]|nr:hypothetical protein L1887_58617 [Cichorium endivia]
MTRSPAPASAGPPIRLRHPLPPPPHLSSRPRSKEARSSYASTSASASPEFFSTSNATSPYYTSSHPSPASTSSGSSLRTPPDLLVNGSSVGHAVGKAVPAVNSWNGRALKPRQERKLNADEIRRRKRLLCDLPQLELLQLPSPPPSPKLAAAATKRPREDDRPVGRHGSWSPTTMTQLAAAYRSAARELKHAADARAASASASRPSYVAARPTEVSALQQLDAVLLFCHAFWLDDLASPRCVAKNWISLFGLLRYATNAHADLGNDVLLGVCRLVEAAVLRKLHRHDSAMLLRDIASADVDEIKAAVERQTADLERADRLAAQARNLLAVPNLAAYPELCKTALASTVPNTEVAARGVDPSTPAKCAFAWPLDCITPMPLIVAFGRAAVAEHAQTANSHYDPVKVATT